MKKYKFLLLILTVILILSGCSKDFLNEPEQTTAVSDEVVFSSRTGVEALIAGMLRLTRGQYERDDSAGINSYYYARTVKGNDIIQGPTWFLFDYAHDNREPTFRRVNFSWNLAYDIIDQANTLIQGVTNSGNLSNQDKDELLSQGLALRAFYYFQIALEFQGTYAVAKSEPTAPIYLEPTAEGKPLSTLEEIYEQIVLDLTTARDIGTTSRLGKSFVNTNVINGMLSRVYLVMENWSEAESAANAAYQGFPLMTRDQYREGFSDMSNPEWIWGMLQTSDQTNFFWGAPHAHADHNVLSYQGTFFNDTFVNRFSATDARNIFIAGRYGGTTDSWNYWTSDKFSFTFESDHALMRSAEMMLTEAEAIVRQGGRDAEAQALLFAIQSSRDPEAVASGNTGDDLIEEILIERRKELYAELGIEWFDAKRLQRGITRDGNHRVMVNVPANGNEFILKIPQAEIDANEFIGENVNAGK